MKKSEFKAQLAQKIPDLTTSEIEAALRIAFDQLGYALSIGRRVEIRGFGSFNLRVRPARLGRNPKTGEAITLARKVLPHFKPGKLLKQMVDCSQNMFK